MTPQPLSELLDAGWAAALAPAQPEVARLGDFLRAESAAGRGYLPSGPNVLRAFTYPFDDVRVLIVGQDPYPTPGHPVGLSFSVDPGVRPVPRSLQNIYKELHDDLGVPVPSNGDLTPWAAHGVLLLNRVLTVRPGASGSHRGGTPLVAILWGRDAGTLRPLLGATPVIASAHPSPLSASSGFFGSRPFSRANDLLVQQGASPIDWSLSA